MEDKEKPEIKQRHSLEEVLQPSSDFEIELWSELDQTDKPIRNILKRLNRIAQAQFPRTDLKTIDSCSGHVQKDGSLEYPVMSKLEIDELVQEGLLDKSFQLEADELQELLEGDTYTPSVILNTGIRRSKLNREMMHYFRGLFKSSVEATNESFGREVIDYEEEGHNAEPYSAKLGRFRKVFQVEYFFPILDKANAFSVMKSFWEDVEKRIDNIDNLGRENTFNMQDFYHANQREYELNRLFNKYTPR